MRGDSCLWNEFHSFHSARFWGESVRFQRTPLNQRARVDIETNSSHPANLQMRLAACDARSSLTSADLLARYLLNGGIFCFGLLLIAPQCTGTALKYAASPLRGRE